MKKLLGTGLLCLLFGACLATAQAQEVCIYTGNVNWIGQAEADAQADICQRRLDAAGITNTWINTTNADPQGEVLTWVNAHATDGQLDVLILYGYVPPTIYQAGNGQPDGSPAELFIESTDGNAIMNHGDWFFYVSSTNNGAAGFQNLTDTAMTFGGDNTPMTVTADGKAIAPNLSDYVTDRGLYVGQLSGNWFVEKTLAQNADGSQADPVIIRDGDLGRVIPLYQTNGQNDPKGAVAAEVIAWLMGVTLQATQLGLSGPPAAVTGTPVELTLSLLDGAGIPTPSGVDLTIELATTGDGAFDTEWQGDYDGSLVSLTFAPDEMSKSFYYKETTAGTATLTATVGAVNTQLDVEVLEELSGGPGEVLIYTGNTSWIGKPEADAEAAICVERLNLMGVPNTWIDTADHAAVATWVTEHTNEEGNKADVLILYGYIPPTIAGAAEGSPAELFIESTDGNAIINHGDWMFYVSSPNNGAAGLQNIMDLPGITMAGYNDTLMTVTHQGGVVAPSLTDFLTDRPLHLDGLGGQWFVEASLAQDPSGTLADPIIVRDANRGRVIPALQAANQADPKGAVAAEIIAFLYGIDLAEPTQVGILGRDVGLQGKPMKLTAQVQNLIFSPTAVDADTTVDLVSDSLTGLFDVAVDGDFDGTITSVTVAAGTSSADFYYLETTPGTPVLTGSSAGLADGTLGLTIFEQTFAPPGDVAIYTGKTWWIAKADADVQAGLCAARLDSSGILANPVQLYPNESDQAALATWVGNHTNNGKLDVLVLYGCLPRSIYPNGNTQPDGSIAEAFIESTDGNAIINSGDWMFYVDYDGADTRLENGPGGLQNMMDIATISMSGGNNPMVVTEEGMAIAPHLSDFLTDRPFHVNELAGNWIVEAALAQSADGTQVDPIIVRDGDAGRLIPLFQADAQNDPKGIVAAEIIAWLAGSELLPTEIELSGASATVTGTPVRLTVRLLDGAGVETPSPDDVTVDLASDSGTGVFDTVWDGDYDGTVNSLLFAAGETYKTVYYMDTSVVLATLSATDADADLPAALRTVNVLENIPAEPGEVLIYTGNVGWIDKAAADAQAQICVNALTDADISNSWISEELPDGWAQVATWVGAHTNNGKLDVLILYGFFPPTIYPSGNTQTDGSPAELFIESNDGDVIINHADWMFYVSSPTNNGVDGLKNMMDNPNIELWYDNTPVSVTYEGSVIAPSLGDLLSDRPIPVGVLQDDWFVEAALAENAAGTLAEPVILRDGNRGRLIPVYQTNSQDDDPKGAVAAEIIIWLTEQTFVEPTFVRGDVDASGVINITDAINLLDYLFQGGSTPPCMDAADVDNLDDGAPIITDAIYLLGWLFQGTAAPPPPTPSSADYIADDDTPECGPDPEGDADGMDCLSFPPCGTGL
jgi:hypothetical protein